MASYLGMVIRWADRSLRLLIALMVGVMLAVIVLQVFCRYALGSALSWPEELSRYLMIWSGLLAAVYAYHEGSHVGVTFLLEKLNKNVATVIVVLSHISMGIFLCVVAWQGVSVLGGFLDLRSPALRIPIVLVYAAVPVSALLMLLVCLKIIHASVVRETRSEG